jgi:hypothetical protein
MAFSISAAISAPPLRIEDFSCSRRREGKKKSSGRVTVSLSKKRVKTRFS